MVLTAFIQGSLIYSNMLSISYVPGTVLDSGDGVTMARDRNSLFPQET